MSDKVYMLESILQPMQPKPEHFRQKKKKKSSNSLKPRTDTTVKNWTYLTFTEKLLTPQ